MWFDRWPRQGKDQKKFSPSLVQTRVCLTRHRVYLTERTNVAEHVTDHLHPSREFLTASGTKTLDVTSCPSLTVISGNLNFKNTRMPHKSKLIINIIKTEKN